MKNAREGIDVVAAYQQGGSYRGAAEMCGTTHKTEKRIVTAVLNGDAPRSGRRDRGRNYDNVAALVANKVEATSGRISAKRLLPRAGGLAMTGRRATSVAWCRQRRHYGDARIPAGAGRGCGRPGRR